MEAHYKFNTYKGPPHQKKAENHSPNKVWFPHPRILQCFDKQNKPQ